MNLSFLSLPGAKGPLDAGAFAWDWNTPPYLGIGFCRQTSLACFKRAEEEVKRRHYLRMAA